ncbi:hypothetical cytosolic protein [Syntrophus aciditrophicus SB]|uniref:Hypothetical cytosolic protein n=1 Tax=Syntrophus aciditrophicus (strain SB) TaxID=56780 RepID=Q2LS41_SYNAS|nr:hypothetical cytosolic protein [Syntrophus aciditrophicus SB]
MAPEVASIRVVEGQFSYKRAYCQPSSLSPPRGATHRIFGGSYPAYAESPHADELTASSCSIRYNRGNRVKIIRDIIKRENGALPNWQPTQRHSLQGVRENNNSSSYRKLS